jgi:outer membrane protein assembly factor BamE (lipoprotein component of BamABCDE complex)
MNRMKHKKATNPFLLLVLPFIVLLAGCMSTDTSGVKISPAQLEQIKIGQTTQAEVISLLGKPSELNQPHHSQARSKQANGQTEMTYDYLKSEDLRTGVNDLGALAAGPIIASESLFDKSRDQQESVTIIIGKDGKVADIKRSTYDNHSTGLFVRDDYPNANMTKVDQIQPGTTTKEQVEALLGAPPMMSEPLLGNTRQIYQLWFGKTFGENGQFDQLGITLSHDGIVDEVHKCFKGARWFPRKVSAEKVAQVKERQSTRKSAESIFGRPSTISRNVQGSFYTYSIQVGKIREGVYIQYDNSGVITRLIRKQQPELE